MVVAAVAGALVARVLRVPALLGFVAAGLVLGPLFHVVRVEAIVGGAAELGIAFLLFFVGLEMSLPEVRSAGRVALIAGSVQMAVTFALGALLASALGLDLSSALLVGAAVAFSSTVVTVKVLAETGDLSSTFGRATVGILLVQDLAVMLVLAVVTGLGGGASGPAAIGLAVGEALLKMVGLLVASLLLARYALPPFFRWVTESEEAFFLASLGWLFTLVVGSTLLGLSLEAGAFIAGVGLAQLPYSAELRRRVSPLLTFFIALFFLRAGLELDFVLIAEEWVLVVSLALFALLVKPLILALTLPRAGMKGPDALRAAVSLGTVSEFGFILAALAASLGLVEKGLAAALTSVALLTMVVASPVLAHTGGLARRLLRVPLVARAVGGTQAREPRELTEGGAPALEDHVVVIGWNPISRDLVARLHERAVPVALVTLHPVEEANLPGVDRVVFGSPESVEVLEEADFRHARMVVSALPEPGLNLHLLQICNGVTPFASRAETREIGRRLELAGAVFVVVPTRAAADALLTREEEVGA